MTDVTVYKSGDPDKEDATTPREKIAIEKIQKEITLKSMTRELTCWCLQCDRDAVTWVREVQFDLKNDKIGNDQAIIDTSDYSGPIPGFCRVHDVIGPKQLAETIYSVREEFKWGAPASRWFVVFTDGTKQGGQIKVLDIPKGIWEIKDSHTLGSSH